MKRGDGDGVSGLPGPLRWILGLLLPGERRDDVLGDLEEGYRATGARLGAAAARRRLWREVAALLMWRLGAAFRPSPRPTAPRGRAEGRGADTGPAGGHRRGRPWTGRTTTMG
ncbi:MAG TPA: hypothetical protein VE173_16685, partial [Longimicrobiales bacterium]|nr:hypothetical protein [Longimicrobiales bacterium]